MVEKMKKFDFLVFHRDYTSFMERLRERKVIHIVPKIVGVLPAGSELEIAVRGLKDYEKVEKFFGDRIKSLNLEPNTGAHITGKEAIDHSKKIQRRLEDLTTEKQITETEIEKMKVWGSFNWSDLKRLSDVGYVVRFYCVPTRNFKDEWKQKYNVEIVNVQEGKTYFVCITSAKSHDNIDLDEIPLSERTLPQLIGDKKRIEDQIKMANEELDKLAIEGYYPVRRYIAKEKDLLDWKRINDHTVQQADGKLMVVEGFVPEDQVGEFENFLNKESVYYECQDPKEEDYRRTPSKLKNNSIFSLFEFITRMFSLPYYSELDPTPFFAPFFMLFFGLCLGDAGYALIILVAATIAKRKMKDEVKRKACSLFQVLGGVACVIGFFTGGVCGVSAVKIPIMDDLYKSIFHKSNPEIVEQMLRDRLMMFSIGIGIIQILFAMVLNGVNTMRRKGVKYSIATLAWTLIIALTILKYTLPMMGGFKMPPSVDKGFLYAIYALLAVAFLYNSPGKNIFLNIGSGLWALYEILTSFLGDVLSYIRLFAIGLTGGILGGVFNDMAFNMTGDISFFPLRFIIIVLILSIGHGLNFGIASIGSLVHPVRLIFVEFYKNLEFRGGGIEYNPFSKHY